MSKEEKFRIALDEIEAEERVMVKSLAHLQEISNLLEIQRRILNDRKVQLYKNYPVGKRQ